MEASGAGRARRKGLNGTVRAPHRFVDGRRLTSSGKNARDAAPRASVVCAPKSTFPMSAARDTLDLRGPQSSDCDRIAFPLSIASTVARRLAQQAQVKTDREREDVTALYPAAQALAVDLCDTIEFYYRKDPDDASRRAKCKRWGVVYFYEPNEPQDPEPTPTPAPANG